MQRRFGCISVLYGRPLRHDGGIWAAYPKGCLQCCIVHQIRPSTRFVSWNDIKQVAADLKKIYTAVTLMRQKIICFSSRRNGENSIPPA